MELLKHCPYCLRPHYRKARACSQWCENRIRARQATGTRSCRRAIDKLMESLQKPLRHRTKWRAIAMGENEQQNLLSIFGHAPEL